MSVWRCWILELQTVVGCRVGVGNWTEVLSEEQSVLLISEPSFSFLVAVVVTLKSTGPMVPCKTLTCGSQCLHSGRERPFPQSKLWGPGTQQMCFQPAQPASWSITRTSQCLRDIRGRPTVSSRATLSEAGYKLWSLHCFYQSPTCLIPHWPCIITEKDKTDLLLQTFINTQILSPQTPQSSQVL